MCSSPKRRMEEDGLTLDSFDPTPCIPPGGYALLRTILYATCESDPLAETGKLMKKFGVQEAKQGIKVERCVHVREMGGGRVGKGKMNWMLFGSDASVPKTNEHARTFVA